MGGIVESVLAPPTEACLAFEPLRAPRGPAVRTSSARATGPTGVYSISPYGGEEDKTRQGKLQLHNDNRLISLYLNKLSSSPRYIIHANIRLP